MRDHARAPPRPPRSYTARHTLISAQSHSSNKSVVELIDGTREKFLRCSVPANKAYCLPGGGVRLTLVFWLIASYRQPSGFCRSFNVRVYRLALAVLGFDAPGHAQMAGSTGLYQGSMNGGALLVFVADLQ